MTNEPDVLTIPCRSCGEPRALEDFRLFKTTPEKQYMDFCVHCEKRDGTITLYRRYNSYGTPAVVQAVFAAERVPEGKRTQDQVRLLVTPVDAKPPESNEEVIRRELARRELMRRRLIFFTTAFQANYTPGWVHHDICRNLEEFVEACERGESPRLMIFMPPRHGKTELISKKLPAWILGRHPEWPLIGASYAQSLPLEFSREIRDIVRDPEYQALYPGTRLRTDSQGVESWKTSAGGGYIAAGVGVGITGKGMMVGILDDPLKDQEAASSETIRDATNAWYQSVFRTRLAPGGGIIIVLTRWHDMDPAGALLAKEAELRKLGVPESELEGWKVISYPAIAEKDEYLLDTGEVWVGEPPEDAVEPRLLRRKGEALHPERYPLNELQKIKNTLAPPIWSALYQQNPTPDDGEFFKRHDFRYHWLQPEYLPSCRVFITADYAISTKRRRDFTVIGVFALTSNNDLYLIDMVRDRWGTLKIVENLVAMIEKYKPEVFAGEQGQIHMAVWPLVEQALQKKGLFISVDDTLVPMQDKDVRARPLQGRTQMHKLYFSYAESVRPSFYDEVERELLRFPNGTHDDIVDMLAWGARLAMNLPLPQPPPIPKVKSWRDQLHAPSNLSHMAA